MAKASSTGSIAGPIGLILLFTAAYYAPFFDLSQDVIRVSPRRGEYSTDITPHFGIHAEIWRIALTEHGELPHWNPYIMGGTPFLAKPGINLVSLQNALAIIFRGQVAARLSIPLHVAVGWVGLLLFTQCLGLPAACALVAGVVYLFNPSYMGYHALTGHLTMVHGAALAPWLLYVAVRPFENALTRYLVFGLVLALVVHAGSPTLFLYLAGLGLPALFLYRGGPDGWAVAGLGAALAVLVTVGASAVCVLPAAELMRVSDRQFGISAASGFFREYPFRLAGAWFVWLPVAALSGLGAWRLWRADRMAFALCAGIVAFALAISQWFPAYRLLVEYVPFFGNQRIPQRSLFLAYLGVGLLAGAGALQAARALPPWPRRAAHAGLLLALAGVAFHYRPLFPTLVDLASIRERNPVLARVRRDPDFFRLAAWEDRDRHWSWEHQTLPYRLHHMLGYARLWHIDYLYSPYAASVGAPQTPFIPAALDANYAFAAGLMAVKYVASTRPLEVPGLELLERLPLVRGPQPPKSRGPYLYRNRLARPRAYRAPAMAAVRGSPDWVRRTSLELVARGTRTPFVLVEEGRAETLPTLDRVERVLAERPAAVPAARASLRVPRAVLIGPAEDAPAPVEVRELSPQRLVVPLADDVRGWLVFSEKFALFPGWRAELVSADGRAGLPILRANHVNSAVWIPPGDHRELRLRYATPWFAAGVALLAVTLASVIAFALAARRRTRGRPAAGAPSP